jgi:hypothetical protein
MRWRVVSTRAEGIAKALIDLGEATSSTRARSLGYGVASLALYLRGSEAAAIANAERAIAVANEPVYREFGRSILANIFAGFGRVEPAVVTVNACDNSLERAEPRFGGRCSSQPRR